MKELDQLKMLNESIARIEENSLGYEIYKDGAGIMIMANNAGEVYVDGDNIQDWLKHGGTLDCTIGHGDPSDTADVQGIVKAIEPIIGKFAYVENDHEGVWAGFTPNEKLAQDLSKPGYTAIEESQYEDDRGVHDELSRENDDGTIECPHCDGAGKVDGATWYDKENCKACNGTGRLEESIREDDYDHYEGHGWSGSDWYEPLKNMDAYIDKHGLSPETIMQAANNEAEAWSGPMGYRGDWTAAAHSLKDAWIRMTKRGQQLSQMFAQKESIGEDDGDGAITWGFNVDFEDVELTHKGKTIAVMSMDDWDGLVNQARRIHRSRDV